jgi:hypothetical protein
MKYAYQIVAALLLLIVGASGADCLAQCRQMSEAERACCQHMAGQCDMNSAAKHPCCRQVDQQRPDAMLKDSSNRVIPTMLLQSAAAPALRFEVPSPLSLMPACSVFKRYDPPTPSVEILRV